MDLYLELALGDLSVWLLMLSCSFSVSQNYGGGGGEGVREGTGSRIVASIAH